jgi:predicted unusual protein kinase regulating ubiquinone biosynthesis (AarF/ABC1/UbiB family)
VQVLAELQDRLPPFSSAAAMQVLEQELGRPAHQVFLELSETPVAAASFGQVGGEAMMDT